VFFFFFSSPFKYLLLFLFFVFDRFLFRIMSYNLVITLDEASKKFYCNQTPPFFLNMYKEVSVGPNTLATQTIWLIHRVVGGTINVTWNSTYEIFFTKTEIKQANTMTPSNPLRTPANTGYSYKWDGKGFVVSGPSADKSAIEVINATNEAGVFGINQTVNDGIDPIAVCVHKAAAGGKIEFVPKQNVTMWMTRTNPTPSAIYSPQVTTGALTCHPNVKNEISLENSKWVPHVVPNGNSNGNGNKDSGEKKRQERIRSQTSRQFSPTRSES